VTQEHDLIVIGAGPGGSNAAAAALQGGLSVAQVDRRCFPRVKPCAGALTVRARRSLLVDTRAALRREFDAFELNLWSGGRNVFRHRSPLLSMFLRPELDNHLVDENRRQERFRFLDGEPVEAIEWREGAVVVRTPRHSLRARQLVGADGAYSVVNRAFGVARPLARAVAVEVNLYREELEGDPVPRPCFDFGAVDEGYGWVFPKDDHLSVGLYSLARGLKGLRGRLAAYAAAKGLAVRGDPLASFEAHLVPVGGYRLRVPEAPVYVVGDAGGFADALTGEGIYHALESGRLAGLTAVQVARGASSHRRYYRRLWRRVLSDTFLSYRLSRPFYRRLRRSLRVLGSPLVWRPLVHGFGRGATLTECLVRGGPYLAQSLLGGTAARAAD